jgi:hypothetical protein
MAHLRSKRTLKRGLHRKLRLLPSQPPFVDGQFIWFGIWYGGMMRISQPERISRAGQDFIKRTLQDSNLQPSVP